MVLAPTKLTTGTAKMLRHCTRCATTTQQTGMVMVPTTNPSDANRISSVDADTEPTVIANTKFIRANPKNEMWPSRYNRRV